MTSKTPTRRTAEPVWKQFLRLGEQLARQKQTLAQCQIVEELVSQILSVETHLWLTRPLYPLPGEDDVLDLLPSAPAPDIVQRARMEQQMLVSDRERIHSTRTREKSTPWIAAAPLISNTKLLGVLYVERPPDNPLTTRDIDLLEGMVTHAATALEIARQEKLNKWRLEQLGLVRKVSAQIANLLNLDLLCKHVTELIADSFQYYFVSIFTLVGDPPALEMRAFASQSNHPPKVRELHVQRGEGIVGSAFESGQQVLAPDALVNPLFRFHDALPETLSEAAFPLKIENNVLGVLDIQSDVLDGFHEIDVMVLSSLADNIALAIQTARLYTDLETRVNQISSVAEISHALNSYLEIDQLLDEIVDLIQQRFGHPHVHIFSVHEGRRLAIYQAGSGDRSGAMRDQEITYSLDSPQGIIPWVARNGQSYLANDVSVEPLYVPSSLPPEDTRAELAVPLLYGQQVLGVLDIQSTEAGAFSESDRNLFETLASTIAVSYRNASLYRSERWRRQVAESFRDVAYKVSNYGDLDILLEYILERLESNLPCDAAAIFLSNDQESTVVTSQDLQLASVRGVDRHQLMRVMAENPDVQTLLDRVLQNAQPYIRAPGEQLGPLGTALSFDRDYSALSVPLHAGNRVVGLMSLVHHTSGRYGSEASSMTATFASYAAVAIQNSRLYNEAQNQAWVATMLVQVAEASQSVLSVGDLLGTMLRLTRLLVGVRKCAFLLRLENQPYYELKSWYGFEPNHNGSRYYPITLPALVNLQENHTLYYLQDLALELGMPEAAIDSSNALYVLMPMQVRGEITGALMVALQVDNGYHQPPQLDSKSVSILQGIAHQTSVTVENLRLLEARQEEAYVTAALLQVAQAVVSTSELPEVLENIVHLLPILVGIDVCLLYRWDEDLQIFRPTNAHGENRRQEYFLLDNAYLPGEHYLLDSVLERGVAHICTMTVADIPADEWPELSCEPLEAYQQAPHQVQGDWLLGFPLLVQGRVMGILVVRERNTTPGFRERRIEILNGIAQQTSMAVQNDLYKREMVQNERNEREIQLARQIQETFLPDRLPVVEGWEIDIRWQTARQVGGDFYDVFELDDGRIGLVVADVSDKGLPAALYMTVARTLIRASVRDHADPAKVLDEVNHLLFTESPESMFITAVYAVLDLRKGELLYANAGHNLPLLYRAASASVEQLPKGGMAMGVIPDYEIEDHTIALSPGDSLLLFTDGACDTLSPSSEDFGEQRLRDVLQACGGKPAGDLLSDIDQALIQFRQSTPLTDDITLVAVRRSL